MRYLALCLMGCWLVGCGGGAVGARYQPQERIERWSDADWQAVLDVVATPDGYVRWDKLKDNVGGSKDALLRYVGQIGAASHENRPELFPTDADKQAYMINA